MQCISLFPDSDPRVRGGALHVHLTLGFRRWADDDGMAAGGHALSTDDWGRLDVGRGGWFVSLLLLLLLLLLKLHWVFGG